MRPLFVQVTEPGEYTYYPKAGKRGFSAVHILARGAGAKDEREETVRHNGIHVFGPRPGFDALRLLRLHVEVPSNAQHGAVFSLPGDGTYTLRPAAGFDSLAEPEVVVSSETRLGTLARDWQIELWDGGGNPVGERTHTWRVADEPDYPQRYGWSEVQITVRWEPRVQRDEETETVILAAPQTERVLRQHAGNWVPQYRLTALTRFPITRVNKDNSLLFDFHVLLTELAILPGEVACVVHRDRNVLRDDAVCFRGYYAPPDGGMRFVYPGVACYTRKWNLGLLNNKFHLGLGNDDDKYIIEGIPDAGSSQTDIEIRLDPEFFDCSEWNLLPDPWEGAADG